ncbi:MAG: hypothetical protein RL417_874 [Pseudomonadota bacterium]|jgi:hypothetical protein
MVEPLVSVSSPPQEAPGWRFYRIEIKDSNAHQHQVLRCERAPS